MLHYQKTSSGYQAWTESYCGGRRDVSLTSPTIQAVVAYAKKNKMTLHKHA